MNPATWPYAASSLTRCAARPIATTSSTSQSTKRLGSSTVAFGPVMLLWNLVNTVGESGRPIFDSLT